MTSQKARLRETGIFTMIFKYVMTFFEFLITPVLNMRAPAIARYLKDIPYVSSPERRQKLDLAVPLGKGPFPVLVYVHGGGFITMDKRQYARIAKCFAAAGYLTLNVNYRRAPRFRYPCSLADVGAAVAWALANARSYGGDPSRLFLAGDSAGAHLVSTYSTSLADEALRKEFRLEGVDMPAGVAGLVLIYGAFDCETVIHSGFPFVRMMLEALLSRDPELFKARARQASPCRNITGDYPPCFVTWAERDHLAGESEAFVRELEAKGVPCEVFVVPASECRLIPHGFYSMFWRPCARKASAAAIGFLDRCRGSRSEPEAEVRPIG